MSDELDNFLNDLIKIIQDKYTDSLNKKDSENEEDMEFRLGCNFAYFDILDIIEVQIKSYGLKYDNSNQIAPTLGRKINE